jgi:hypothetical protein
VRIFAQSQSASDSDDSHEEQNKRPKKSQVVKKSFDLCKSSGRWLSKIIRNVIYLLKCSVYVYV